jgi:hypothetical protein
MLNFHIKSPINPTPSSLLLDVSLALKHPLILFETSDLLLKTALQGGLDLLFEGSSVPVRVSVRLAI